MESRCVISSYQPPLPQRLWPAQLCPARGCCLNGVLGRTPMPPAWTPAPFRSNPRRVCTQLRSTQQQQQQQQQLEPGERALQLKQRLSECSVCAGTGRTPCKECHGQGYLPRGGYARRNPLNMSRAVGSKWTAMVETLGWRHFRVIAVRKLDGHKHNTYLLLQASCDSSAQLWVNALTLRNRSCWAAGWLQMSELLGVTSEGAAAGIRCHSCSGLGYKACPSCDGQGRTELVEV